MLKIFKTCCLILIIVLPFSISAYAAEPKNINELIEQGKSLDGQKVTIQGEAIGDAMKRGDFTWININDGSNAIGIWMKNSDAKKITNYGNYKSKGDIVQIHGIFYRACAEHGGEADIHSEKVDIIKKGYPTLAEIPYDKIVAAAILSGAALVLVILFRKKQKFTSTES